MLYIIDENNIIIEVKNNRENLINNLSLFNGNINFMKGLIKEYCNNPLHICTYPYRYISKEEVRFIVLKYWLKKIIAKKLIFKTILLIEKKYKEKYITNIIKSFL